jgi:hypothetical protein
MPHCWAKSDARLRWSILACLYLRGTSPMVSGPGGVERGCLDAVAVEGASQASDHRGFVIADSRLTSGQAKLMDFRQRALRILAYVDNHAQTHSLFRFPAWSSGEERRSGGCG